MARTEGPQINRGREDFDRPEDYHRERPRAKVNYEDASPEDIEADIRRTRAEMDQTLEALSERLHPRRLLDDVMSLFRGKGGKGGKHDGSSKGETAKKAGKRVLEFVRDHPVPSVLMTTAVTTLIYESATSKGRPKLRRVEVYEEPMHSGSYVHAPSGKPYYGPSQQQLPFEEHEGRGSSDEPGVMRRAGERMREIGAQGGEKFAEARETMRSGTHRMRESMSETGHRMREGASHMREQMQHGMERGREQIRHGMERGKEQVKHGWEQGREFVEERPLAVGIGALAVGLLAGLLIPRTKPEDKFMGEESDEFMHRAKETGREAYERGKEAAAEVVEAAGEEAQKQGEQISREAEGAAHRMGEQGKQS